MPRCVICDHSNDVQHSTRKFTWEDEENGYVCSHCKKRISDDLSQTGRNPHNSQFVTDRDLELLEFLENDYVDDVEAEIGRRLKREDSDTDA